MADQKHPAKANWRGMTFRSNADKHTSADDSKRMILSALLEAGDRGLPMSCIGYAAFPGYSFKSPQAAAFACARLVRELEADGLLMGMPVGFPGRVITAAGISEVRGAA